MKKEYGLEMLLYSSLDYNDRTFKAQNVKCRIATEDKLVRSCSETSQRDSVLKGRVRGRLLASRHDALRSTSAASPHTRTGSATKASAQRWRWRGVICINSHFVRRAEPHVSSINNRKEMLYSGTEIVCFPPRLLRLVSAVFACIIDVFHLLHWK